MSEPFAAAALNLKKYAPKHGWLDDTAATPVSDVPALVPDDMRPEDGSVTETYTITGAEFASGGTLSGTIKVEYSSTDDSTASGVITSTDLSGDGYEFVYNVSGQSNTVNYAPLYGPSATQVQNTWQAQININSGQLILDWATETPTELALESQTGLTSAFENFQSFSQDPLTDGGTIDSVCYLRGTGILTARGEVPVEALCAGDVVATRFGPLRAVKWIGRQSFAGWFLGQRNAPVCFKAGSLGDNVPARDLSVSPAHSMLIGDRLVMASLLVNGVTITQAETSEQVDYFHIDLGVHDCVVANGAWSESYAEHGNRRMFHNHDGFAEAFPLHDYAYQDTCLPRIDTPTEELLAIQSSLLERLPAGCVAEDADLHLLADGRRIDGVRRDDGRWVFDVPSGIGELRLVSRANTPVELGLGLDGRVLGFCLNDMTLTTGTRSLTLRADDPAITQGVHNLESGSTGSWRWTDGNCLIPAILHDGSDDLRLTVSGKTLPRYLLATAEVAGTHKRAYELAA